MKTKKQMKKIDGWEEINQLGKENIRGGKSIKTHNACEVADWFYIQYI